MYIYIYVNVMLCVRFRVVVAGLAEKKKRATSPG